jgi:class 3 adenylate cyclase
LWEPDADRMRAALARHHELVRTVVEGAQGAVFKHTGDGFGAAFDRVSDGLRAASGLAAELSAEDWEGAALRTPMRHHAGEAEPTGDDYFGPTVTRAARVMDAGNGGQILVSRQPGVSSGTLT